jgi:glycerol uptake facilitator-like aquaporin
MSDGHASASLARRSIAEAVGTSLLLATVVGSGIMGDRLSGGNVAIALLANAIATGAALVALILTFGPISGAHFNPVVTLGAAWERSLGIEDVPYYLAAQLIGAATGVGIANLMFDLPVISLSQHARNGASQLLAEFVATFGLVSVIRGCAKMREPSVVAFAVGAYITAAYWFTSSTSFANPAVTVARCLSDTFAGIRPIDVPGFVIAQLAGGTAGIALFRWLASDEPLTAGDDEAAAPRLKRASGQRS